MRFIVNDNYDKYRITQISLTKFDLFLRDLRRKTKLVNIKTSLKNQLDLNGDIY